MKKIIAIVLAVVGLCVMIGQAHADSVTLAWDENNPPPEGYRIYQREEGQPFDYTQHVYEGSEATAIIEGLAPGTTYYFVVRAFSGNEISGDSNELAYTPSETEPEGLTCLNIRDEAGRVPDQIAPGLYLLPDLDLIAEIKPPPENDVPPYSVNKAKTIYHRHGCRHYRENQGIGDPAECPTCRACQICGGDH